MRSVEHVLTLLAGMCIAFLLLPSAAFPLTPTSADSLYARGHSAERMEDVREVVSRLNAALPATAHPAGMLTRIGNLYVRLQEADSAEVAFDAAVERDSTLAGAYLGLGEVLLELRNRPRAALVPLQRAVELDSTYAEAHYMMARAYLRSRKTTAARRAADKSIQVEPNYAAPYLFLAKLYQRENNNRAAFTFYKAYLEQRPNDQTAAYEFAVELLKQKELDRAREIAERLGGSQGLPVVAQALMADRDYEGALDAFSEYIDGLTPEEQALFEDISLVGLSHEVRAYRTTTPETREAFLRNFWLRKDPFKSSAGAMRRAEHYRRVWYARTFFGKKRFPYDRRGEIYIRYGEPDFRSSWRELNAQMPLRVQRVQERMAHQLYGNRALALTFVGPVYPIRSAQASENTWRNSEVRATSQPIQTIDEAAVGLERYKPITSSGDWSAVPWAVWIYADIDGGIEIAFTDEFNTGNFDYAPEPVMGPEDINEYNMQSRGGPFRNMVNRLNAMAPAARMTRVASREPERYAFEALEPLDYYYEALSFRGLDGKTELQLNIGLPIDNVARREDIDTTVVVNRRVALVDSRKGRLHKRNDDLAVPVTDANLGRSLLALDRVDIAAAPGVYQLAVEAWRKKTDMLQVYQQTLELPDYRGEELMMSDIQIAQNVVEAREESDRKFVRQGWDILPAPSRTFYVGKSVFVYFEVYNLEKDAFGNTRYEVTFEVISKSTSNRSPRTFLPRIRKDGESIEVRYEQSGTETSVSDFVELDLGQADPGRYSLHMTVKDLNADRNIKRDSIFRIASPPRRR
ncbi:MAG: GWxTD domain-containing protein [Gemmatimonadota bacterium]|nr:GWxTD domain-containing protein [Gemmatimonadota bacterium]